jgi:hypothetical protein
VHPAGSIDFFYHSGEFALDRHGDFVYIHPMMFAKALQIRRMHAAAWLTQAVAEGGSS